ncbi:hypothetical protein [Streptomyces sp. CS62]|uniref:hypothetical protein n=1 Tax=Streptomyces sp. CS62 TaxID=3119268 RepID=UPI002F93023D
MAGERDLSRHPLAQASFTLLNTAPAPARLAGLDVETVRTPLAGTPLDVFLDLSLRADGAVAARLQFSTALFDRDSMVRFADGYTALLRAVTDAPGSPLTELTAGLEPLPGRERRRLLEAAGRADGAAAAAGSGPFAVSGPAGAPALVCGDETLTYGGLDALSRPHRRRPRRGGRAPRQPGRGVPAARRPLGGRDGGRVAGRRGVRADGPGAAR